MKPQKPEGVTSSRRSSIVGRMEVDYNKAGTIRGYVKKTFAFHGWKFYRKSFELSTRVGRLLQLSKRFG